LSLIAGDVKGWMQHAENRWHLAGALLLSILTTLVLTTFSDYGSIWDEEVHFLYGEQILAWIKTFGADRAALSFGDLYLYGGLFDVCAALSLRVSSLGIYETRHLVNVLAGLVGLFATWRLGTLLGGARTGTVALLFLALSPVFYGHMFNNPKDIPFASFATFGLYMAIRASRELPRPRPELVLGTGIALGAALGTRAGGLFLLGYVVLLWSVALVLLHSAPGRLDITGVSVRLVAIVALAWTMMVVCWPWAQLAPLTRPIEAAVSASRFRWIGPMLFRGQVVQSNALPWDYLPTWFAVSLPEHLLAAPLLGVVAAIQAIRGKIVSRRALLEASFLVGCVVFPIGVTVLVRPVMYDAQRQFIFILPPLAVLAAWSLIAFFERVPRTLAWAITAVVGVSVALTAVDMVRLHPYQTVYFNRAFGGGLAAASERFETDYWGASYREGIEAVARHYRPDSLWPVTVANCSVQHLSSYWLSRIPGAGQYFVAVRIEQDPDIILATTRYRCHEQYAGTILHVVRREGVPLLYVIERRRRGTWLPSP